MKGSEFYVVGMVGTGVYAIRAINGTTSLTNTAISMTGAVRITDTSTLTVGSGATVLGGSLKVTSLSTFSGGPNVTGTVTATTFNALSDRRIKVNITDMNCSSLEIMRKIKPREYKMIDGSKESVYGFVAQEIKEIIPKSIYLRKDYIPSVYENAFIDGNQITLINKSTTDISCCKLKLRNETNSDTIVNVTSIHDNKTFSIDTDISSNIFCMDIYGNKLDTNINNGTKTYMLGSNVYTGEVKKGVFVYGIEVDDFHTINKDTIWTVTLSATQEMDVQLQEARRTIRTLEERISAIEKRLS